MTEERNRATIRDYLQTLWRRKFVIVGIAFVAAVVGFGLTLFQAKTYSACASLQAQSLQQSAGFAGLLQSSQQLPQETAAQLSQTATRPEVMQQVKSTLRLSDSVDAIRSRISTSQDQQSDFVQLCGDGSTPSQAASLTNAAASAVANVSNKQVQQQFAGIATGQMTEAASLLAPFAGKKYGQLTPQEQARFQANAQEAATLEQLAARLSAFSKVVTVAQVVAPASLPGSPSSPHPILNIIIGAVIGLILGLLVTWFLESLDRRLRRPDETEALFGLPVVGAVPHGALGRAPGDGEDGASIATFRMLRTNVRFLAPDEAEAPRTILVTSAGSEEGKTTVALGLALSAAGSGLNTLLIEADVHRPVHASRLGLKKGPGLVDYLREGLSPQDVLQVHAFVDPATGHLNNGNSSNGHTAKLTCITAGDTRGFIGDRLGSKAFAEMLAEVREVYDLIVIDSAPLLAVAETSELVTFVDAVVFCVRLGSTTVEQAKVARASIARLPERLTGLVITDLAHDLGGYYGYSYSYAYGAPEEARATPEGAGQRR
jgi:Mrp family chromosome partitioning ATPase/capsular polysaccharide biosynthesis protein